MNYRSMDIDSAEAIARRRERVKDFLDRHGLLDENDTRDTSDVHQWVRFQPVHPLDVAEQVGNDTIGNLLWQEGARRPSRSMSVFRTSFNHIFRKLRGRPPRRSHASVRRSTGGRRSILRVSDYGEEELQSNWV